MIVLSIQLINEKTRTTKFPQSFEALTNRCEVWIYEDLVTALRIIELKEAEGVISNGRDIEVDTPEAAIHYSAVTRKVAAHDKD